MNLLERREPRGRVMSKGSFLVKKESAIPFSLLLFYLFLEYGRPQTLLPFLKVLRLSGIAVVLLALSVLSSGKIRFKEKQTILFLFLLGLMVIHGPIAVNNYWTLMIFITMVMNFIVFLALIHCVDDQEKYDRLLKTWLGIHVFLAIVGFLKKGVGVGGFLGDENDFCLVLNMIIPFSFFFAVSASGKERIYYIALTGLFLFVIILTGSRGGFVGLCTAFIYCWLRSKRKILVTFLILGLSIFAYIVAPKTYHDEIRSITEQGTSSGTGEQRIYTWNIGWHMFLDNPIIGVGQGNFPYVFQKYEFQVTGSDEPYYGRSVAGRAAHSIYFTLLPELGLIGTILFLMIVLYTFSDLKLIKKITLKNTNTKASVKPDRSYFTALALEGSLITYLASSVFISTLYYPNFWFLIGFIISYKNMLVSNEKNVTSLSYAKSIK